MEELVMPDESDRRRGRVVRVPAEDQPNELEHRVVALESELQEARDHNRRMEKELWEATNKISQLLSERYGADAASTGLGEDRDTAGRGETTEATSKLDAELGQAAFSAAHTGRLNLENVDRPLVTTDVAISAESFHRCATVLDAVQMDYPMVHLAPSWAPLDPTNSDHREPTGQGLGAAVRQQG
jgi:hypothetical protein